MAWPRVALEASHRIKLNVHLHPGIEQFNIPFMKSLILVEEFQNSLRIQHSIILFNNIEEHHSIF